MTISAKSTTEFFRNDPIDPKTQILVQLEQHQIQIYNFPESELEPEVNQMNNMMI